MFFESIAKRSSGKLASSLAQLHEQTCTGTLARHHLHDTTCTSALAPAHWSRAHWHEHTRTSCTLARAHLHERTLGARWHQRACTRTLAQGHLHEQTCSTSTLRLARAQLLSAHSRERTCTSAPAGAQSRRSALAQIAEKLAPRACTKRLRKQLAQSNLHKTSYTAYLHKATYTTIYAQQPAHSTCMKQPAHLHEHTCTSKLARALRANLRERTSRRKRAQERNIAQSKQTVQFPWVNFRSRTNQGRHLASCAALAKWVAFRPPALQSVLVP